MIHNSRDMVRQSVRHNYRPRSTEIVRDWLMAIAIVLIVGGLAAAGF